MLASTESNSSKMLDVPLPRGKRYGKSRKLPAELRHSEQAEARDGQLRMGKPLGFWLYLVQVGRAVWYQRARMCFLPPEVLGYSTVPLLFLSYPGSLNYSRSQALRLEGWADLELDSGSWLPLL